MVDFSYGFHASSKYTIHGSYVIYLPTIYLQFIYINSDIHLFSSEWQMFHWAYEFGLTFRFGTAGRKQLPFLMVAWKNNYDYSAEK